MMSVPRVKRIIKAYLAHLFGDNVTRANATRYKLYKKLESVREAHHRKVTDLYNKYNPGNKYLRPGWWADVEYFEAPDFVAPPKSEFPSEAPINNIVKRISRIDDIIDKAILRRNITRLATATGVAGVGSGAYSYAGGSERENDSKVSRKPSRPKREAKSVKTTR